MKEQMKTPAFALADIDRMVEDGIADGFQGLHHYLLDQSHFRRHDVVVSIPKGIGLFVVDSFHGAVVHGGGLGCGHKEKLLGNGGYIRGMRRLYTAAYKSMREFFLVFKDIVDGLGGVRSVARLCVLSEVTVSKWGEDPNGDSGQWIPVKHLRTVLAETKRHLSNLSLQSVTNELLQDHFASLCGRRVMLEETIVDVIYALQNGCKPGRVGT